MRTIFLLITFNLILTNIAGQKAIEIPEFKNINPNDKFPERSILVSYTNNFDILISLNCYSAWGPDNSIKVFAHHVSGWYKIDKMQRHHTGKKNDKKSKRVKHAGDDRLHE